jgi:hypothetical protein
MRSYVKQLNQWLERKERDACKKKKERKKRMAPLFPYFRILSPKMA